ncbi:MAG: hypothetical protein QMD97_02630 [Candidatus Aenigmarchaeota archaeon]|nr:hypothetical protein [Candidatus Aenigmarchaeota archaeon]MDI6737323.1 hypothetical protein [Nanoarchaeota archaeon]
MKKLILLLMAMLVVAGIASAEFDVYYTGDTSPYKRDQIAGTNLVYLLNGTLSLEGTNGAFDALIKDLGRHLIINLTARDGCYISGRYYRPEISAVYGLGDDGRVFALGSVAGVSEDSELSLSSDPAAPITGYIGRYTPRPELPQNLRLCNGVEIVSPLVQGMDDKVKLLLPEEVTFEYKSNCAVEGTIDPSLHLPCVEVSSPSGSVLLTLGRRTFSVPREGVAIYPHAIPCTDSDGGKDISTAGQVYGVHEYFTGRGYETAREIGTFPDMCSAALRPGPTEGVPYAVVEWYCENNKAKYEVQVDGEFDCPIDQMCSEGRCVALPASPRSGACASVECAEGEVCRAGVCVSTGAAATEDRKARVRTQLNKLKTTLAKIEANKCGTPLKTTAEITGVMDMAKLTAALTEISAAKARIAKCAGVSLEAVPAVSGANTKDDASKLLAWVNNNAKTMKQVKADVGPPKESKKEDGKKTPADDKKTPVPKKKPFLSSLFSK